MIDIKNQYDFLINKYGQHFKSDYGWAYPDLGKSKLNFKGIEEAVGYDLMRPFYSLANLNVHGGSEGLFFRLGSGDDDSILLAGNSIHGFGEPIQNTAYSLANITSASLLSREDPNLDRIALARSIYKLSELIFNEVDAILAKSTTEN